MSEEKRTTVGAMARFNSVRPGVGPRVPAADRNVRDVALPSGGHVFADTETVEIAGPRTEPRPDRQYLLAVEPTAADTVRTLLEGASTLAGVYHPRTE